MALTNQTSMSEADLIAQYVETADSYPEPTSARIKDYGVSVKALIIQLRGDEFDLQRTADAYNVPVDAVIAAKSFYEQNAPLFDAAILLQHAAFA